MVSMAAATICARRASSVNVVRAPAVLASGAGALRPTCCLHELKVAHSSKDRKLMLSGAAVISAMDVPHGWSMITDIGQRIALTDFHAHADPAYGAG